MLLKDRGTTIIQPPLFTLWQQPPQFPSFSILLMHGRACFLPHIMGKEVTPCLGSWAGAEHAQCSGTQWQECTRDKEGDGGETRTGRVLFLDEAPPCPLAVDAGCGPTPPTHC